MKLILKSYGAVLKSQKLEDARAGAMRLASIAAGVKFRRPYRRHNAPRNDFTHHGDAWQKSRHQYMNINHRTILREAAKNVTRNRRRPLIDYNVLKQRQEKYH